MKSAACVVLLFGFAGCVSDPGKSASVTRAPSSAAESLKTRDGASVNSPVLKVPLEISDCPSDMSSNSECILPDETALFDEVVRDSFAFQSAQNPPGVTPSQRDFHARHHACLAGVWKTLPGLPESLAIGVLAHSYTVPVVPRYSNGSSKSPAGNNQIPPDGRPDARGLAIKLVGIPGESALNLEDGMPGIANQDFVMINYPAFFLRTPKSYPNFLS